MFLINSCSSAFRINITGIDDTEKGPIITFSIEEVVKNENKKQTEIQIEDGNEKAETDMFSTESGQSLTSLETQSGENNLTHDSKQSLKQKQTQAQSHESIEQTALTINDSDNSNSKDTPIIYYSVEELTDYVRKISKENAKKERITFLDFAGQSMYYAFHQIYLSPETFYILVVDMGKKFESTSETKEICGGRFASWKYKGNSNISNTNTESLHKIIFLHCAKSIVSWLVDKV